MLFSHLKKTTNGQLSLDQDLEVSRFSTDTRNLTGHPSEVFIAIKRKRDGHDYIKNAISKGTRNFIVSSDIEVADVNVLLVSDTLKAFHQIAYHHRKKFKIPLIGITGSNGKTIVKEWLSTILSEHFYVVKSPRSYNSQIGVPTSLMEIKKNHEVGIFEAGISQKGEMEHLQKIINPTLGVFTNLGHAHDDGFDSLDQKLEEKLALFSNSEKVICRGDTSYFAKIQKQLGDKLVSWNPDGTGKYNVKWNPHYIAVNSYKFQTEFSDPSQLENLTHAIVAALEMGLAQDEIQRGVNLIENVPMRLELKEGINGCYLLDDTYNNDVIGLKVALDYLESHQQNSKRTLILSDILHSGLPDEKLYKDVSDLLKSKSVDRLIGVGPRISAAEHVFQIERIFFDSTDALLADLPDFKDEMVVIKGARDFELERVTQKLEERSHGTVLEVNFESLQYNLNQYRNLLKPTTKLMVMVKANAYGSGLLEVANFLQHQRVDMLGVAYVDEAILLRKNGIHIPIMIMNPHIASFDQFEKYDLQAEIFSFSYLNRMMRDTQKPPKIHLKIDTGMHRLGFAKDHILQLTENLKKHPDLIVESIFTHFSSSDMKSEDTFTSLQAEEFDDVYNQIVDALGYQPIKHACNSAGMVRWPQYHYDMVRLGIGLHGFDPSGELSLRHSSQLKTVISQIQHLKAGDTVGYSRKGKIENDSKIAIIPIGYEDGYSRIFGNGRAHVRVNDILCPTVGNVCMDMTMIDVTDVDVSEGDEVIIFGNNPEISDLAKWSDTIPYEILTNVSNRVKRVFVSE
ncbi:alanine racemase [Ekhidna lutea]|uniref:Alanine racemase n=1 Tax=Ekhidna lutea TaxID=447679 RepID=A0A239IG40_EKHLU|nr:bifunctional UDP-N-acetylmuramoyl-tripeptide:D-alanyl-D-alanine ligase/alanine racemase [Ekhidna lutea]SNS91993.1 alanine racemase [Ekhidna lutea]